MKKNLQEGSLLLRSAAELGNSEAKNFFGMLLMASEGVEGRTNLGVPVGKVTDIKEEQKYNNFLKDLRRLSGKK